MITLLLVVVAVWAAMIVCGILVGSAIGRVARQVDEANDRDLARELERRRAATDLRRASLQDPARRPACRSAGAVGAAGAVGVARLR